MRRRNRFLIGLAAAAITFSSLFVFVGPGYWQSRYDRPYGHHHGCYQGDGEGSAESDQEVGSW